MKFNYLFAVHRIAMSSVLTKKDTSMLRKLLEDICRSDECSFSYMSKSGWIPLEVVVDHDKLKRFSLQPARITTILAGSAAVQLSRDGKALRPAKTWRKWVVKN